MSTLAALKAEIDGDPLRRGLADLDDQGVTDALNAVDRTRGRAVIPAHEVVEVIEAADFAALTGGERARVALIVSAGEVNIGGANTRAALAAAFGAGTTTAANLVSLQTESISRADELGLGQVHAGDVAASRGSI
jgi:hypothetical protein